MSDFSFSVAKVIAIPSYLRAGAAIATPTPIILGELQDCGVDMSMEVKLLHTGKRFAIAAAHGNGKIEIKAKNAVFNADALGIFLLGQDSAAGIKGVVLDSEAAIPGASPYTLTIAPPNSGAFVADLGVVFSATGDQLTRVVSAPTTGQYSVNTTTGVYTFAVADKDKLVKISYEYSASTGGKVWNLTNSDMAIAPSFSLFLVNQLGNDKKLVCKLSKCVTSKFNIPSKSGEFNIPDFDAQALDDGTGSAGYICRY